MFTLFTLPFLLVVIHFVLYNIKQTVCENDARMYPFSFLSKAACATISLLKSQRPENVKNSLAHNECDDERWRISFEDTNKRTSTMPSRLHIQVGNNISIVVLGSHGGLLPVCVCLWVIVGGLVRSFHLAETIEECEWAQKRTGSWQRCGTNDMWK